MSDPLAGELERALEGPLTIDFTTTGRLSGEPRRIEIWLVNIDGRVVICGTPGPRDWMANVRVDSEVILHFKERERFDVAATASEVTDAATRRQIWEHRATDWYRTQSSLQNLIETAPTIALTLQT